MTNTNTAQKANERICARHTLRAVLDSGYLYKLSGRIVSVKAGHGDECLYLDLLENRSELHRAQTYFPGNTLYNQYH